jgi:hypothetical protein
MSSMPQHKDSQRTSKETNIMTITVTKTTGGRYRVVKNGQEILNSAPMHKVIEALLKIGHVPK